MKFGGEGGCQQKKMYVYLDKEVSSAISKNIENLDVSKSSTFVVIFHGGKSNVETITYSFLENTVRGLVHTSMYTRSVDLTVFEFIHIYFCYLCEGAMYNLKK